MLTLSVRELSNDSVPNLEPQRLAALAHALRHVERACNVEERLAVDPVGVVRRYQDPHTCELVGLLAASLAFGNVVSIRASIEGALQRLGSDPLRVLGDREVALERLEGFRHRMVQGRDIGRVLVGARQVQLAYGSLGKAFEADCECRGGSLRGALSAWTARIRERAGFGESGDVGRRGPQHVMSDPLGASGCKRLMLYLRWMVRPDDGVDMGLWGGVSTSMLLMPVDTHVHRIAKNLGLTKRGGASWLASEDITSVLRRIDPVDPVRFDFALCHFGMSGGCPAKPDARCCGGCVAREACAACGVC